MIKLPKRTKSQRIGASAADLLSSVLDEFCIVIPVPQDRDVGIDFICEVIQGEYPTGKLFNIQCKGKEEAKIEGNSIVVSVKVTTLNYWLLQSNPTFLVLVDRQNSVFIGLSRRIFSVHLIKTGKNNKQFQSQFPFKTILGKIETPYLSN